MAGCDAEETGYRSGLWFSWYPTLVAVPCTSSFWSEGQAYRRVHLPRQPRLRAAARVGAARGNRQGAEAIMALNRVAV